MTIPNACVFFRVNLPYVEAHLPILFEERGFPLNPLLPPLLTPPFMRPSAFMSPRATNTMLLCVMEFYSSLGVWKGG